MNRMTGSPAPRVPKATRYEPVTRELGYTQGYLTLRRMPVVEMAVGHRFRDMGLVPAYLGEDPTAPAEEAGAARGWPATAEVLPIFLHREVEACWSRDNCPISDQSWLRTIRGPNAGSGELFQP